MSGPLPENIEDAYPLTPLQQGMLFHSISSPETGVYIEQISVAIDQPAFSVEAFKNSWELLLQRHSAFRTAFVWKDLNEPLQVVRKRVTLSWNDIDWRELDHCAQQSELEQLKQSDRETELSLNKAPLMHMTLVRLSDERYIWVWTRHHLIADGWSTSHVLEELTQLYRGEIEGHPVSLNSAAAYRNYIAWLKQRNRGSEKKFWQDYLSDFQNRTRLDIEKHRTSTHQLGRFAEASCRVQARDFSALETLCKSLRITPNIAIQAAWSIFISRYSNTDDVVWGTTVSGRPAELAGVEETVGLFINTIPLRTKINWEQSTTEFLQAMQQNQIAVMEFENTSLRDITRWSELPNGEPLFQSVVVYENYPSRPNDQGDTQDPAALWFSDIEYKEQSDLPLALIAIPEQDLKLILIYDQSVFEPDQIQRILEQLKCLLSHMPYHANAPLNTVPFLPREEADTLLYKWNQTQCEFESENFIDQLILEQAKIQPDATALVCGQDQLSYGQMERRSLMLLEHLTSRTIGPGDIVGICLPRGVDALVWMLAVLRSGAAYLMLDPDYPSARLRDMLERSGASLVISDLKNSSRFRPLECLIVLDDGSAANETDLGQKQNRERNGSDNAYILYTSGSTGKPKGVTISHRNLVHSTAARSHFYPEPPTSFLLLSSFSFDSSVAGIYWTLTTGGKLVISQARQEQDVDDLLRTISKEHVTHTLCLPSLHHSLLEHADAAGSQQSLDSMQVVINAGEAMPSGEYLELHRSVMPGARIINEYGPTESTVWCSAYDATHHDSRLPVPIGKPIANTRLFILDQNNDLAPIGVSGELVVAGNNLSGGYWKDDEATQRAFRRHNVIDESRTTVYHTGDLARYTEDGNIIYLGRTDQQIKIRGHRIEPQEIESRILSFPGVIAASVIVLHADKRAPQLIAFVVVEHDFFELSKLKDQIASQFPDYMVPASFIVLDALPFLANGKLDRQSLIDKAKHETTPSQVNTIVRPPSNEVQKCLQGIWQEVLGAGNIGIDDNFFDLGGDSILSIRIVSKMLQAGYKIGPNDIFEAPTIDRLSAKIDPDISLDDSYPSVVSTEETQRVKLEYGEAASYAFPLTDTQTAFLFAHLSRGHADPGHMQIMASIEGDLDLALLERSCSTVVSRHDALRTGIHWRDKSEPEQVVFTQNTADIIYQDLRERNSTKAIEACLKIDRDRRLAIDQHPNWRIYVFRLPQNEYILCWSFHHALIDGWSASIILREVIQVYQSELQGIVPNLSKPPQFVSYQQWLQQSKIEHAKGYWKSLLAPLNRSRDKVPVLGSSHSDTQKSASIGFNISGDELLALEQFLRKKQVTLAQALQGAWSVCLSAASEAEGIAFFVTVSGRAAPVPEIDNIVGQFVNHLPIVLTRQEDSTFTEIISQIKHQSKSLRNYEHISPSLLQSWCADPIDSIVSADGGSLGVQSLVMMENFPWQQSEHIDHPNSINLRSFQQRGRQARSSQGEVTSNFPLTLVGIPEVNSFTACLHLNPDLFDLSHAEKLMECMKHLLITWSHSHDSASLEDLARASRAFFNIKRPEHQERPKRNKGYIGNTALEKSIVAIWQEILGHQIDHVDQNFFELGGNSLSAVRVAEAVERLLDIKMPLAMLIEHSTVQSLAEALSKGSKSDFQIVVPIQPHGDQAPVFGIHAEGNVLFYRDLSLCLGEQQPFFGLQSPELRDGISHFASIEQMATTYIKEIKKVRPSGPYNLCGMCFGGLIAFEIARQLVEYGDRVNTLIVFDSGGPQLKKSAAVSPSISQSRFRYSRTAPLIVKVFKHLRTGRLRQLTRRYIFTTPIVYKMMQRAGKKSTEQSTRERIRQVRLNQAFLTRQYKADVYPGEVTFLYSEQFKISEKTQYELSLWREACGGQLTSFLVSGHHRSILEPPQVYEVAEIVKSVLEKQN